MIRIFSGPNNFLLRTELRRVVDGFVAEHTDMALERIDGEDADYARIQESVQSLPFLAPRKMVVLHTPGSNKQFAEKAAELLGELPDTTDLIIVESKLDKRSSYYKLLKKQPGYQEFNELDENGLARWLSGEARSMDASLSSADARYLIERVGSNQQLLAHELEKLLLYDARITRATIDLLTVAAPQSSIFQLLEAAFDGNVLRTLQLYREQRALKVEPQQIIAMLAWQLHVLALVKSAANNRTPDVIAREAKINPYVVRKSAGIVRGLSLSRIKRLVRELVIIDDRLKRESLNGDDVLQHYLLELAQ